MRFSPASVLSFFLTLIACQPSGAPVDQGALRPESVSVRGGMVRIPAGSFVFSEKTGEPAREVSVAAFYLDVSPVTVGEYARFVDSAGYQTAAERFGNSAVFIQETGTWQLIDGANFRYPLGPGKPKAPGSHPVTHVDWEDAAYYCKCMGKRLPTGKEWEYAAKNAGKSKTQYAWGDQLKENNVHKANTWQGVFPYQHQVEDGFVYTSPVGYFGKTPLGLTDMGGNVWNWVQDDREPEPAEQQPPGVIYKEMRGGSFLCDPDWCHGFRTEGVTSSSPESSLMHVGFRCAKDAP
jgi:sulfatase modifying factor 1